MEQLLVASIVEVWVVVPGEARGAAPGVRVLGDLRTVDIMGHSSAESPSNLSLGLLHVLSAGDLLLLLLSVLRHVQLVGGAVLPAAAGARLMVVKSEGCCYCTVLYCTGAGLLVQCQE